MNALMVQSLRKTFSQSQPAAVNDVSFEVAAGHILALVGPSGCGKTTLLRLVAGLERPDSGRITIQGRDMVSENLFVPPEKRGVAMVFQDHALFPHLTVFRNIAFGIRDKNPVQARKTAQEMLELVGLQGLGNRYPHSLSGGERQRVALARALAPQPALVLMDEPFSSLDADMRLEVREQVRKLLKATRSTVVFVTHDQDEALYMGDTLAVLNKGKLEQIGTPEEIYHAARSRFVSEFMGDSDFIPGTVTSDGVLTELGPWQQSLAVPLSSQVELAVRADDVNFDLVQPTNGRIVERFFRGAFNLYRIQLDSGHVVHAFKEHTYMLQRDTRVRCYLSADHPLAIYSKS